MPLNQSHFLQHALMENGYDISSSVQEKILQYLHLMREWNRVFNLTSILDPQEMIMLHILDSLAISSFLHGSNIIDIGTGAGLPGIPLALTQPNKSFVLLDSNNKKTRFLTQVIHELKIPNVKVVHQRAEGFTSSLSEITKEEDRFDSILSRAFASLRVMLETTKHLAKVEGQFLAMKGVYPEKEIHDIPKGFKILAVHKLTIKGLNAERHLVCMEKVHKWEK